MKNTKVVFVSLVVFVLMTMRPVPGFAQVYTGDFATIRISAVTSVDQKGDLHMDIRWRLPTDSIYTEVKKTTPMPI